MEGNFVRMEKEEKVPNKRVILILNGRYMKEERRKKKKKGAGKG